MITIFDLFNGSGFNLLLIGLVLVGLIWILSIMFPKQAIIVVVVGVVLVVGMLFFSGQYTLSVDECVASAGYDAVLVKPSTAGLVCAMFPTSVGNKADTQWRRECDYGHAQIYIDGAEVLDEVMPCSSFGNYYVQYTDFYTASCGTHSYTIIYPDGSIPTVVGGSFTVACESGAGGDTPVNSDEQPLSFLSTPSTGSGFNVLEWLVNLLKSFLALFGIEVN